VEPPSMAAELPSVAAEAVELSSDVAVTAFEVAVVCILYHHQKLLLFILVLFVYLHL